jgi:hypothetical protein
MDPAMLGIAVVYDVVGMIYEGYPLAVIRRLWLSQT